MKTFKLLLSFLLVSLLSAGVAIGTYSYLNEKNKNNFFDNSFSQQGFRMVNFATPAENTDFTYAAEQTVNAVVHIKSVMRERGRGRGFDPYEYFFGGQQRQPQVGFGSGVIISADGYIITNNHVIEGAEEIEVKTNDNQVFKAKVIGRDDLTDIALLKIDGTDFHTVPLGDSDQIKVGEWVLAVGNPFNLTSTVTAGIVSAKGRGEIYSSRSAQENIQSYIQTDAAVNPGNSGGALVNTKGELIGINTAIVTTQAAGNFMGHSFAVPINIAKKIANDLKQYGVVQRAILGIRADDLSKSKEKDPEKLSKIKINEGAYIDSLFPNSTAQKAGIQVGDVITDINGTKIKNYQELRAQLSRYSPGNKVEVQVYRNDATKTFTVELKNDQGTTEIVKQSVLTATFGANFRELSKETRERMGINYGIEVFEIANGKLRSAGIRNGFIILTAGDKRISSLSDLEAVVESVLKKESDNRGLLIGGTYPQRRRVEYAAVDLND